MNDQEQKNQSDGFLKNQLNKGKDALKDESKKRAKKAAKKIQSDSDVLVVIGIGGSYLGARAAIECLGHSFRNHKVLYISVWCKNKRKSPCFSRAT